MQFSYSRKVYLGDTDAAGVVYFAKGLAICHEAYEESLADTKIEIRQMLNDGVVALPIIHAEIDFHKPMFCGDLLVIKLKTSQISKNEFAIASQIFNSNNLKQTLIKAKTHHVCINPQTRTRLDLPINLLNWLRKNS